MDRRMSAGLAGWTDPLVGGRMVDGDGWEVAGR